MGKRIHLSALVLFLLGIVLLGSPFILQTFKKSYGFAVNRTLSDDWLENHENQTIKFSDFKGNYIFLYSGYTRCGSICGSSMQVLKNLSKKTPANTKFIFLSLDPSFDTKEILSKYVSQMGKNFIGIRQKIGHSFRLVSDLEIQFSSHSLDTDISHTDTIYLIDKKGTLRFIYPSAFRSQEKILNDLNTLEIDKWQN